MYCGGVNYCIVEGLTTVFWRGWFLKVLYCRGVKYCVVEGLTNLV